MNLRSAPVRSYLSYRNHFDGCYNLGRLLTGSAEGQSPFAGGMGYPPFLNSPQDWGIQGVEKN